MATFADFLSVALDGAAEPQPELLVDRLRLAEADGQDPVEGRSRRRDHVERRQRLAGEARHFRRLVDHVAGVGVGGRGAELRAAGRDKHGEAVAWFDGARKDDVDDVGHLNSGGRAVGLVRAILWVSIVNARADIVFAVRSAPCGPKDTRPRCRAARGRAGVRRTGQGRRAGDRWNCRRRTETSRRHDESAVA